MALDDGFVVFTRGDGSKVACRIALVLYVGKGEHGSILHFGAGAQVNVQEDFDEVLALLTIAPAARAALQPVPR